MRIFFDFDDCLTHNAQTVGYILQDAIAHCGAERVSAVRRDLAVCGFTLEAFVERLGMPNEKIEEYRNSVKERSEPFEGVVEGLSTLRVDGHELILISSGVEGYQRLKIESIDGLLPLFNNVHIIWGGPTKGDVIAGYGAEPDDVFVDNSPKDLVDVRAKAPWVRVIRMMHPDVSNEAHEGDGVQWEVVHSVQELQECLKQREVE